MSLSAFLRESPALRQALEGEAPFSSAFNYTKNDLLFIRDNASGLIWDYLARSEPLMQVILGAALATQDVRTTCKSFEWVSVPQFENFEEEMNFCLPLVKHAISVMVCVLGRKSAMEFLQGVDISAFFTGLISAVSWLERASSLTPEEVRRWQAGSIAHLIGILAVVNFPTMRFTGACRYLAALEATDELMHKEFIPRLVDMFKLNPSKSIH